jgi:hypothetical protein
MRQRRTPDRASGPDDLACLERLLLMNWPGVALGSFDLHWSQIASQ